ncbi:rhamnulokinase [Paenibacillus terrigena]|uniref:rhamnulokinase n=1 Tax=Paenibacillus terrigena TaxID=369333 RepID=UPI00037D3EF6|nr:rhamnulokinase [Paenibacillus terrigena]
MNQHIAIDIGASSGRVVAASLAAGQLHLREIHRFKNDFTEKDGHMYWDIEYLSQEIVKGLQLAKQQGIEACTLGIDTWAVDYVLLDDAGSRMHEVYAYRDHRTEDVPDRLHQRISREIVYAKTGIQEQRFNTLYQLFAHGPNELSRASSILLVPDYLYYRLSGRRMNERTNASTTQLLNVKTGDFDEDLLGLLQLRKDQFASLQEPGEFLGSILPDLVHAHRLPDCQLVVVPTHDTASAVVGVPIQINRPWAYLSSGTWSLLGVERDRPIDTLEAMRCNYTNEWGAYGTYRFLKNIMGMWMIQEVRRELGEEHSYAELTELASLVPAYRSLVPCNAARFLSPKRMILEMQRFCQESGQPVPMSPGELARCIFDSLALTYYNAMQELNRLHGQVIEVLHIVGGGSQNALLCQLTADVLEIEVQAGPSESTALGNIAVQMISSKVLPSLQEARRCIAHAFPPVVYMPQGMPDRESVLQRWQQVQDVTTQ